MMKLNNFSPFGPSKYYGQISLFLLAFKVLTMQFDSIFIDILGDVASVLAIGYFFAWIYHRNRKSN